MIIKHKTLTRAIASFTLFCFLLSNSAWGMPVGGIEIAARGETPGFLQIEIPPDLASIEEIYEAPPKVDPKLILHVQNIHADYQAQSQIRKLLQYLHNQYGFKLLFVEGAADKLDPEYLKLYEDSKKNVELADSMAKNGELTGVDYYLTDSPEEVEAFGIEDPQLYRQNFDAFKKAHALKEESERFMGEYDEKLNSISSKVFPQEARRLLVEWKKFESGHRDFLPYIKRLSVDAKNILGLDLESLFAQVEWPQITRLLALQSMEPDVNVELAQKEKLAVIDFLKAKRVSQEIITAIQKLDTRKITMSRLSGNDKLEDLPRYLFERLAEEAGPKGFYFRDFPHFSLWAGHLILQNELDSRGLFEEIELLFSKILDDLTQSERQRDLLELYRDSVLLRKLFALQLTRKEWDRVLYRRDWIEIDAMKRRLNKINQAVSKMAMDSYEVSKEPSHNPKASKVDRALEAGFQFYDFARKRETAFYDTIKNKMAAGGMEKAVLVTGGFHTDGLLEMFREEEINIGVLIPKLNGAVDTSNYVSGLLDNKSSLYDFATMELTSHLIAGILQGEMTGISKRSLAPLRRYFSTAAFPDEQSAQAALQYLNQSKFGREIMPFAYVLTTVGVFIRPKDSMKFKTGEDGLLTNPDGKFLKIDIVAGKDKLWRYSGSLIPVASAGELLPVPAEKTRLPKTPALVSRPRSELRTETGERAQFDPHAALEVFKKNLKAGDTVVAGDAAKLGPLNDLLGRNAVDWLVAELKAIVLNFVIEERIPAAPLKPGSDEFDFGFAQKSESEVEEILYRLEEEIWKKFSAYQVSEVPGGLSEEARQSLFEGKRRFDVFTHEVGVGENNRTIIVHPKTKNVAGILEKDIKILFETMPIPFIPFASKRVEEGETLDFDALKNKADRYLDAVKNKATSGLINFAVSEPERRSPAAGALEQSLIENLAREAKMSSPDISRSLEKYKTFSYPGDDYEVFRRDHLGAVLRDLKEKNRGKLEEGAYLVRGPPNIFYAVLIKTAGEQPEFEFLKIDALFYSKTPEIQQAFESILSGGRVAQRLESDQNLLGFKAVNTAFGHEFANDVIRVMRDVIQNRLDEYAKNEASGLDAALDDIASRLTEIYRGSKDGFSVKVLASQISRAEIEANATEEKSFVAAAIGAVDELLEARNVRSPVSRTPGGNLLKRFADYDTEKFKAEMVRDYYETADKKAGRAQIELENFSGMNQVKWNALQSKISAPAAEPVSVVNLTKRSELRINTSKGPIFVTPEKISSNTINYTSRLPALFGALSHMDQFAIASGIIRMKNLPESLQPKTDQVLEVLRAQARSGQVQLGTGVFYANLLYEDKLTPEMRIAVTAGGIGTLGVQEKDLKALVGLSTSFDENTMAVFEKSKELGLNEAPADVLVIIDRAPMENDLKQIIEPLAAMLLSQVNANFRVVFRAHGVLRSELRKMETEFRDSLNTVKSWEDLKRVSIATRLDVRVAPAESASFRGALQQERQLMQKGSRVAGASRISQGEYLSKSFVEFYVAASQEALRDITDFGHPSAQRLGLTTDSNGNIVAGGYVAMKLAQQLKDTIAVYLKEDRNQNDRNLEIDVNRLADLYSSLMSAIKAITRIRSSA
jgi:hypothetical protein